jgi:3-phenylpropionate/trans-cinnamate dioxygenase ferredoxin reductase subunit
MGTHFELLRLEETDMTSDKTFAIVGASLTGAKAAETLRAEGFDGRLVLIGAEPERPYERPPLSKDYLRGEAEKPYVHAENFYAEQEIELRISTEVTGLNLQASELELADGARLRYDALLLATGAEPRRIPVPGADLAGVHYLREIADSQGIGERLQAGVRVAVVGGGWIGAEAAASARVKGAEVTLIEQANVPLERVLGSEVGVLFRDLHRDHGVEFLGTTGVQSFEGSGSVERVVTSDGRVIEADLVIVGVGVAPRTALAETAGLAVDNGIAVDASLRTSAPNVFAAGDVANADHPFYGRQIRVEHWANALNQGPAAARAMLGQEVSYDEIPYFFSDQYDLGMEYGGYATEWDEIVFRGDVEGREFIAFWLRDGRVEAGMNVNVWDVNEQIRALVRSRDPIDANLLTDPETALSDTSLQAAQ